MKKILIAVSLFILSAVTIFAQEPATEEGDTIRDKVQQKVEEARTVPFSYIGTVTDIAEETIQINKHVFDGLTETNGQIQQISINEEATTFVKIAKTTTTVNFSDVAIGDFIIAMGYKNGNDVLEAQRILITTPLEVTTRKALFGEPSDISSRSLTLKTQDGDWSVEFGKTWVGPDLDEIGENDKVIVIGSAEDKTLEARFLEIISPTEE
jgi:sporulation protein YlmC with PRC-barrel domain